MGKKEPQPPVSPQPTKNLIPIGEMAIGYTKKYLTPKNRFGILMQETHKAHASNPQWYHLLNLFAEHYENSLPESQDAASSSSQKDRFNYFMEGAMYIHFMFSRYAENEIPKFTKEEEEEDVKKEIEAQKEFAQERNMDPTNLIRVAVEWTKNFARNGSDNKGNDKRVGRALLDVASTHRDPAAFLYGATVAYSSLARKYQEVKRDLEQQRVDQTVKEISEAEDERTISHFERTRRLRTLRRRYERILEVYKYRPGADDLPSAANDELDQEYIKLLEDQQNSS